MLKEVGNSRLPVNIINIDIDYHKGGLMLSISYA